MAGCGSTTDTNNKPIDVTLTMDVTVQAGSLLLTGTANLPDGAIIHYAISPQPGDNRPFDQLFVHEGETTVSGGQWSTAIPANGKTGALEVWAAFQTIGQPQDIADTYGEMGEHIGGSQATKAGQLIRAEIIKNITI